MANTSGTPSGNAMAAFSTREPFPSILSLEDLTSPIVTLFVGPHATPMKAHKHILTKCQYFAKCLASGRFKESIDNEINLPDDDPVGFAKVVGFLYTHKLYYGNDSDTKLLARKLSGTSDHTSELISAHAMADKYCIKEMRTRVEALLDEALCAEHLAWRHFQQIEALGLRGFYLWQKLKKQVACDALSDLVSNSTGTLKAMLDDGLASDPDLQVELLREIAAAGSKYPLSAPSGFTWP
ncbi:hypothetical protein H2202_001612 [Exophiala xenobiotica]|nr:hypothetical protein H2202_001612 [Exophiala xenobiotica]KAK5530664.1 hypothetical protein LTR23_010259 [Chaetothyriales sp. CCFEE 6169]KAK5198198.1 hypothetical protein LTR92_002443 [Exophiala xenobiotica]KAK5210528.1 hypothetical protein LTR41_004196 [Exophiala xenobiotica]KAK5238676.1 hypothetical protein LTR47_000419 [Exophiala xenobiotica]